MSERRQRVLHAREVEKLRLPQAELEELGCPAGSDAGAALRILGIADSGREEIAEDRLPAERIVHFEAVRRICIDYGLVFRPFSEYRGRLAKEVAAEVIKLRALLGREPSKSRFFIAAPCEMFCDSLSGNDPFLFYEIGPDEYYLVHQWGLDASPLRLLRHWPRGTRRRLFAVRSVACAVALVAYALAPTGTWPVEVRAAGWSLIVACWARCGWEYRRRRGGVHERRWFQA